LKHKDKRRTYRSHAGFCAMVKIEVDERETHYRPATVCDISTNGLLLRVSGEVDLDVNVKTLGVIVDLPDGPGYFLCRVRRVDSAQDETSVGLAMAESDWSSRQALYGFLTGKSPARAA